MQSRLSQSGVNIKFTSSGGSGKEGIRTARTNIYVVFVGETSRLIF